MSRKPHKKYNVHNNSYRTGSELGNRPHNKEEIPEYMDYLQKFHGYGSAGAICPDCFPRIRRGTY